MRRILIFALVLAACGDDKPLDPSAERIREAKSLLPKLSDSDKKAFARVVELREAGPLVEALDAPGPVEDRGLLCLALGRIGGEPARRKLEALVAAGGPLARPARAGLLGLTPAQWDEQLVKEQEARPLVGRLEEAEAFARLVELKCAFPLVEATQEGRPERIRKLACLALGQIGGDEARDRLLALLAAPTPEPRTQGGLKLYAAAGLTLLKDPGTAVDLVLELSTVNPNDNVAALAAEGPSGEYFTVDAQICEALLAMGLWTAEDELVSELKRHDWVRVLIDAHAILRRHTGLDLPFRYNGSYKDREADAEAWSRKLRETRAERERARPFDAKNPRFRARCADVIAMLSGVKVNDRYIAEKALLRLGPHAIPFLAETLEKGAPSGQREAALVMGRIGDPAAAPALKRALDASDAKARAAVIEALRRVGDRGAVPLVAPRLKDEDPEVRANAAQLLGEFGDAGHREALRDAFAKETAPASATRIAVALSRLGDDMDARLLRDFVSGDQLERQAAGDELCRLNPEWKGDPLAPEEQRKAVAAEFRRK